MEVIAICIEVVDSCRELVPPTNVNWFRELFPSSSPDIMRFADYDAFLLDNPFPRLLMFDARELSLFLAVVGLRWELQILLMQSAWWQGFCGAVFVSCRRWEFVPRSEPKTWPWHRCWWNSAWKPRPAVSSFVTNVNFTSFVLVNINVTGK